MQTYTKRTYQNKKEFYEDASPQSFESNDGRFSIQTIDDGELELTMTSLRADEKGYHDKDLDWVQKISIEYSDLDRLIDILTKAKEINPLSTNSMLKCNYVEILDNSEEE